MKQSQLWILLGSKSDLPAFDDARALLETFKISYEIKVLSAHRTPDLLHQALKECPTSLRAIIAAAGGAAHLPGVIAAQTLLPVIGVPMTSALSGFDSLLSIAQMPAGIPVATMAVGKAGASNAAIFVAEVLALSDTDMRKRLEDYRAGLRAKIEKDNQSLQAAGA